MYTAPVKVNHQLNQPVQAQFPVLVKIPDPVLTPTLTRVLISEPHTNQSGSQATVSSTPIVNYPTRKRLCSEPPGDRKEWSVGRVSREAVRNLNLTPETVTPLLLRFRSKINKNKQELEDYNSRLEDGELSIDGSAHDDDVNYRD